VNLKFSIGCSLLIASISMPTYGQWVNFQNQTGTRVNAAAGVSTADPNEKDYAFGDFDKDGDIDLICVRKFPLSCPGGRTVVLFMNENGVLTDRTSIYAQASDVPGDLGFNTPTNNRDSVVVDVNNDTWLDFVTCPTICDGCTKAVGHPRVYRNLGEIGGVWQGFRHEDFRIPQLLSTSGIPANPRFCEMDAGDVNGDGYADLYFSDYDTGEVGPTENSSNDIDNKLLINQGAANPGVFVDEGAARMGATYLSSAFGAGAGIVDLNGDGLKEVLKVTTLGGNPTDHVAVMRNNPANPGFFDNYTMIDTTSPYHVNYGDLNNDGKPDVIVSEDVTDRYLLNTTATVGAAPTFSSFQFSGDATMGTENGFSGHGYIADLDNDGWKDVVIADVDIDTNGCTRRSRIYHNLGNAPNVTLREVAPSVIPTASLTGIYAAAIFDINGDGWNDIVFGKCTSTGTSQAGSCSGNPAGSMEVWINQPPVSVDFTLQGGVPALVPPSAPTSLLVDIVAIGGTLNTSSPTLFTRVNNGSWTPTPMSLVSGNTYQGQLPASSCYDIINFYFSASLTGGGTFVGPSTAPGGAYKTHVASSIDVALQSFEGATDDGWTVSNDAGLTGGAWVRVDPIGASTGATQTQTEDDFEAGGNVMCWVTGQGVPDGAAGAADVDGGATRLLSPAIDLSGTDATISYARWFFGSTGDSYTVEVSNNNGANWTNVETLTSASSSSIWQTRSFLVSDFFPGQVLSANVRVRFTTADTGAVTTCEGGLDAFQVSKFVCQAVPECACSSDVSGDHFRDGADVQGFTDCFLGGGTNCLCAELDGNPGLTDGDVAKFIDELMSADPCP
jgi:hypothetical protein